jgi:hypothetical protein
MKERETHHCFPDPRGPPAKIEKIGTILAAKQTQLIFRYQSLKSKKLS